MVEKLDDKKKEERRKKRLEQAAAGISAGQSVENSVKQMAETYAKPDTYDRKFFDSGTAKRHTKTEAFAGGKKVKDPYSGDTLSLRKQEAKIKYGKKDWQEHLAEADHTEPLHQIYENNKENPWLKNEDIKDAANSPKNMKTISRKLNNAKRDKTNEEFYGDKEYLEDKDIHLSDKQREKAIADGKKAREDVQAEIRKSEVKNIGNEFHDAGKKSAISGAQTTAAISSVRNIIAVLKGDKKPEQALKDIAKETGETAAISYLVGGSVSVLTHSLVNSTNSIAKMVGQAGMPGKIVAAVMATGGTLYDYFNGKISTKECIIQLGETGTSSALVGISSSAAYAIVGTLTIPVPVVGTLIGSTVGYFVATTLFGALQKQLYAEKMAREERERVEKESAEAVEKIREYRRYLNEITTKYFAENRKVFDEALGDMDSALKLGDAEGYIHGVNKITKQLGGDVQFENMKEFDDVMKDDKPILL